MILGQMNLLGLSVSLIDGEVWVNFADFLNRTERDGRRNLEKSFKVYLETKVVDGFAPVQWILL